MDKIIRDIKMPGNLLSRQYYDFIMKRLRAGVETFTQKHLTPGIEDEYAGLYWLLTIAKDPSTSSTTLVVNPVVFEAAEMMQQFLSSGK